MANAEKQSFGQSNQYRTRLIGLLFFPTPVPRKGPGGQERINNMNIQRIIGFLENDLWRHTRYSQSSRSKRISMVLLKVVTLSIRGFSSKNLNVRANSLSYSLFFAVIPILSMILAVAQGFGFANIIEEKLNHSFLGEYHAVPTIMSFVDRYLETAQGGVFIGTGLLVLLWAVYSFFQNVETSFNDIWNVGKSRSVARQLITYIAILFLVPILMVVSSGLFSTLTSWFDFGHLEALHQIISNLLPYLTAWIIFSWMYKAIPNTQVHWVACIVPGVLMGTMFQVLQWALVHFVVILSRTSIVYGAFALVPIFLMCVQWMCLLILIGAQLSYAIQNNENFDYLNDIKDMSRRYEDTITMYILYIIIKRFNSEQAPQTAAEMAVESHIPNRLINLELQKLVKCELIREVYTEDEQEAKRYVPAMDTQLISIGKIKERLSLIGTNNFLHDLPQEVMDFQKKYNQLLVEHNSLKNVPLMEIGK